MKKLAIVFFTMATVASVRPQAPPPRAVAESFSSNDNSNLPVERIGVDDLVGISVYDAPELTRAVRVSSEGQIRLPMLTHPIKAAGLYPIEIEKAVTEALVDDQVLVDPIVTVSVVEYRSRPISVSGAVKHPLTFQGTGNVRLLDAISQAEGLAENAGSEILVSRRTSGESDQGIALNQRISVHDLISGEDPSLNVHLEGGEEVRVPEAGRVFVLGNVKKPGAFYITDGSESSIMKAMALSEGLASFASHKAYIYRLEGGRGSRNEIPVDLKKIMDRKSPDVALLSNDILYVPNSTGARASVKALEAGFGLAAGFGIALLYLSR